MHHTTQNARRHELNLFDNLNARSLIRIAPEAFMRQVKALHESDNGYLLGLPEVELVREAYRRNLRFGTMDYRLRAQFWVEYERRMAIKEPEAMDFAYVVGRAISKEAFYRHYIQQPIRLAFILCPPSDFTYLMGQLLATSVTKLIKLVDAIDDPEKITKILGIARYAAGLPERGPIPGQLKESRAGEELAQPIQQEPVDKEARLKELRLKQQEAELGKEKIGDAQGPGPV